MKEEEGKRSENIELSYLCFLRREEQNAGGGGELKFFRKKLDPYPVCLGSVRSHVCGDELIQELTDLAVEMCAVKI